MEQAAEMSREQAADFERLAAMAADDPAAQAGQDQEAEQAAAVDPVESLAGFLTIAGMGAGFVGYRQVAELWSPETCRGVAEKAVPVLVKYPWGARALEFLTTGAGVEEIALAMYLAPLAIATAKAAAADTAAHEQARRTPEKEVNPPPASQAAAGAEQFEPFNAPVEVWPE